MALTYRTGSDGKDSALTINELDNNFRTVINYNIKINDDR